MVIAGLAATLVAAAACGPSARAQGNGHRHARAEPIGRHRGETPLPPRAIGDLQHGKGTWYGRDWHGRPTASGERFNRFAMTAAHRSLPMDAVVRVTNQNNGRSVTVRINDRGPYGGGRIIDVSEAAARKLGMIDAGVVPVTIEVVKLPPPKPKKHHRRH
jgi:rare lipoprotein A (peptidoglycan hydrolase)